MLNIENTNLEGLIWTGQKLKETFEMPELVYHPDNRSFDEWTAFFENQPSEKMASARDIWRYITLALESGQSNNPADNIFINRIRNHLKIGVFTSTKINYTVQTGLAGNDYKATITDVSDEGYSETVNFDPTTIKIKNPGKSDWPEYVAFSMVQTILGTIDNYSAMLRKIVAFTHETNPISIYTPTNIGVASKITTSGVIIEIYASEIRNPGMMPEIHNFFIIDAKRETDWHTRPAFGVKIR